MFRERLHKILCKSELKASLKTRIVLEKAKAGGKDLPLDENDPYIYILITEKERFTHAEKEVPQPNALSITLSYNAEGDILLHKK